MRLRKTPQKSRSDNYVMYGYKKSDDSVTGFLKEFPTLKNLENYLTDDLFDARLFSRNLKADQSGTPEQWLKFVNESYDELPEDERFVFHLVKTIRES